MTSGYHSFLGLAFMSLCYIQLVSSTSDVYIVYLGLKDVQDPILTSDYHLDLLSGVFQRKEDATRSMVYSYKHSFSGFSAKINSTQAATLAGMEQVISVFKSRTLRLHTTRSWDFMGLNLNPTADNSNPLQLTHGDNTIVGLFDTGIWPESKSFHEEPNMHPIPRTWKGKCVSGQNFNPKTACNLKLVGARYYLKGYELEHGPLNASETSEYRSPRDANGHGTHTASTAVGSTVKTASFFGFGQGMARGGAPRAWLAVYKVCWGDGRCSEADILAAFDEAINDGVNLISASFGLPPPLLPFYYSSNDIGSFHAMEKGISVIFSAGNSGPNPSLVQNVAPWSTCVGASSIDRNFPTRIVLDNCLSFLGESFNTKHIDANLVGARRYFRGGICNMDMWRNRSAVGAVILCFSTQGPVAIEDAEVAAWIANAAGLIFVDSPTRQYVDVDIIPTIRIDMIQGSKLYSYLSQSITNHTKVRIFPSKTVIKQSPAPVVADFSSRGPSAISPDILKPDISAPGISILAAWPPGISPTRTDVDQRSTEWNFQSGTSMSCPHVSGVVALLKSAHPDWSPAAIKSALMTTGAGHLNPLKAMDPGLVYDMNADDYILFLCNNGYTKDQIKRIVSLHPGTNVNCPQEHTTNANLNYPSITVSNLQSTMTIKRTVRNVSYKKTSIYFASIVSPHGVEVTVWPRILFFSYFSDESSYYVTLKPQKLSQGRYDYGEIVWSDGFHTVRSPVVVCVNTATDLAFAIDESSQPLDQSVAGA
ncbi:subtilisin-like protease SBT3.18 isoform X2 [Helianthus annuus]|uniref:subtilisin-like protease SBT3.18 isoform X2 n=2 Tax=Helianthus annuus TaxID=4232 RepID=UPI001652D5E8|nr:subtilisin-like protease SBT3.18 isoform X2 [Helianthus annuus]